MNVTLFFDKISSAHKWSKGNFRYSNPGSCNKKRQKSTGNQTLIFVDNNRR